MSEDPAKPTEQDNGTGEFDRFKDLTERLLKVPKKELDKARRKAEAKRR